MKRSDKSDEEDESAEGTPEDNIARGQETQAFARLRQEITQRVNVQHIKRCSCSANCFVYVHFPDIMKALAFRFDMPIRLNLLSRSIADLISCVITRSGECFSLTFHNLFISFLVPG